MASDGTDWDEDLPADPAAAKEYEAAVASYDQALKIQPDKDEAWNNRGITLEKLGRLEEAIASYDQALKIKPDDHEAWYNRGVALRKLGQLEEAISSYDQALKIKPDFHEAWYNRSDPLFKLGRWKEGMASINKAQEINPDFINANLKTQIQQPIANALKKFGLQKLTQILTRFGKMSGLGR